MKHPDRCSAAILAALVLVTSAAGPASAQVSAEAPTETERLSTAQRTFIAADTDRDGRIDAAEAEAATIPAAEFEARDFDGDGRFDSDEFLFYYAELLERSGHGVGRDLRREVRRVEADRRVSRSSEPARAGAMGRVASRVGVDVDVPRRLAEARAALDRAERRRAARAPMSAEPDLPGSARAARPDTAERLRAARAALDASLPGRRQTSNTREPVPPVGLDTIRSVPGRLDRARRALDGAARRRSQGDTGGSASIPRRLHRAEQALLERARSGEMGRAEHQRLRSELRQRARGAAGGGRSDDRRIARRLPVRGPARARR